MQLDYENGIPLHVQLKSIIESQVTEGALTGQIPSEREFMENFNVSRSTVREAINLLVRDGVLEKVHGKGTFVLYKPIGEWLGNLTSTTETIKQMGMKPGAKLINHCKIEASSYIQELTGFDYVYFIKRVRYADDVPIGVECHYYPVQIGEELVRYDLNDTTLYEVEQNELGIWFAEASQTIGIGSLSEEDAAHLNLDPDTIVLVAERIIKGADGDVIELEKAYYRSDMYNFKINLSRKFG
ncbi:GntR family transcriptional regulator [Virgibacillus siamensis]|uniref:GntR family transcriptional regulator n=1 Tax=Virgibacillus siamensis TaxID=480071 RepID=UPI0009861BC7|nr:GntR family transcriptional regulator [Virgibacillus siamensis]